MVGTWTDRVSGVALRKRFPHVRRQVCIRKAHSSFFAPLFFLLHEWL